MNDERPIEKLLRRAARKRNDEAGEPPELHPANRRMLQAEVARQFPPAKTPQRETPPPFWAALTRRWAYALAVIPVIGIVALMVLPTLSKSKSKGTMNLAQNAPQESAAKPAVLADEAIAPASSPVTLTLAGSGGGNFRSVNSDLPTITAPPPAGLPLADADRNSSARREFSGGTSFVTDSLGGNRENEQVAYRFDSMPENAKKATQPELFSRAVPATAAATAAPTRSAAVGGTSGTALGGAVTASSGRDTGGKLEERPSNLLGKELNASSALATKDNAGVIVATGSTQDGFYSDKSWIARGGGAERQRAVLNSQAFSNLDATQAEAKRKDSRANRLTPPVLVNFKVEQAGRDLRVVDGDGSVYRGVVDEENTLYKQISERQQQKLVIANDSKFKFQTPKQADAISPAKQLDAEIYYLYRVEGTNRTLNQNVVFTWNFVDTNALASGSLNYQNTAQKLDATKLPSQFPALLQNSYINGRAQFGEGREVEVNAVPVK
jgi:hypothetical protein